jgi:hypothetical protein
VDANLVIYEIWVELYYYHEMLLKWRQHAAEIFQNYAKNGDKMLLKFSKNYA